MSIKRKPAIFIGGAVATAGLVAAGVGVAASSDSPASKPAAKVAAQDASATAMPKFRLPFTCGETWRGRGKSYAHTGWEIDFNYGVNGEKQDEGKTVVAAAAGKVIRSEYHSRAVSGYGNVVYIQHSGGYVTRYAHLKYRSVKRGASVKSGQKIGAVGHTSAKYNIGPHLHFETRRTNGTQVPAVFDGSKFQYPSQARTACKGGGGGGGTSPVAKICGTGFKQIDKHALGKSATVYLGYSKASGGTNCTITVKKAGAKVKMSATLQAKGGKAKTDAGSFSQYAGPVKISKVGKKCVRWGGSIGSTKWLSKYGHCG
ncbi:M23 family metallopeptidase [Spirillospora sp. NPDC048911]|uniref:M23 family metallopeptidase n=1 Tax=Spirillospora sp. NPDC048911 TaxID=3364527 RepID=UPI003719AF91